jgi:hypothetical protein
MIKKFDNINNEFSKSLNEEIVYREMVKILSSHEIKIYQARVDRVNTRMQRYFNSTPLRNVFARICNYAFTVNQFYTITYVAKELRSTRQAIATMVHECESEGWLNIKRKPNRVEFQSSKILYNSWKDYVYARINIMNSDERNEWISMLTLYKYLKKNKQNSVKSVDIDK